MNTLAAPELQQRLRQAGIAPTLQRLAMAEVLLPRPVHMTAEQALNGARQRLPDISRATAYAVLQLFVRQGLLKELPVEGAAVVYDSNTAPHHHLYDVDTGAVADLPQAQLQVLGLEQALAGPGGLQLQGVDVIIRVRGLAGARAAAATA